MCACVSVCVRACVLRKKKENSALQVGTKFIMCEQIGTALRQCRQNRSVSFVSKAALSITMFWVVRGSQSEL